jgi:hypothetical protein
VSETASGEHRQTPPGRWIAADAPALRSDAAVSAVMFGVPCYGGALSTATLHGLLSTQRALLARRIRFECATTANESLVTRARNSIVAHFLVSSCSHLFFVDADIGFGAEAVLRILAHDRPVMGGLYLLKRPETVAWAAEWERGPDGTVPRDSETGAVRVQAIGTGFLCLRRDALEQLVAAFPETRYFPQGAPPRAPWEAQCYALFETGVDPASGTYVGEDYRFCARWRSIGGEIWCDPAILLDHHGRARFAGNPAAAVPPG